MSRKKNFFKRNKICLNPIINFLLFYIVVRIVLHNRGISIGMMTVYAICAILINGMTFLWLTKHKRKSRAVFWQTVGIYSGIFIVLALAATGLNIHINLQSNTAKLIFPLFLVSVILLMVGNDLGIFLHNKRKEKRREKDGTLPY